MSYVKRVQTNAISPPNAGISQTFDQRAHDGASLREIDVPGWIKSVDVQLDDGLHLMLAFNTTGTLLAVPSRACPRYQRPRSTGPSLAHGHDGSVCNAFYQHARERLSQGLLRLVKDLANLPNGAISGFCTPSTFDNGKFHDEEETMASWYSKLRWQWLGSQDHYCKVNANSACSVGRARTTPAATPLAPPDQTCNHILGLLVGTLPPISPPLRGQTRTDRDHHSFKPCIAQAQVRICPIDALTLKGGP